MKRFIFLLTSFFIMTVACFAQDETEPESSRPTTNVEIERRCAYIDIEGKVYDDVVITLKSTSPDYFITDKYKVKVTVRNAKGK